MGYKFRTSGPWGPGQAQNLNPADIDNNFWQAIQDIADKADQGVGISNFIVSGNQMTVVLTDHTLLGPYELPTTAINFRGTWAPSTDYLTNDILTYSGATYIVLVNHTSGLHFDPGSNDGFGNDLYGLLLTNPASSLPSGGPAGYFLRKVTTADFVTHWAQAALSDLSDVLVTSPTSGQAFMYQSGKWKNLPLPTVALSNLTDVHLLGPIDGQVLTYVASGAQWQNLTLSMALSRLTDVAVTSPQAGQPLIFDGTHWIDAVTVDIPCGGLTSISGAITINRMLGEVHRYQLVGTVTDVTITGWPAGGQFARLVLEIQDLGGYGFAWPSIVRWPSGQVPAITANGMDVFILISFDGGSTIYGNVVGQAFA